MKIAIVGVCAAGKSTLVNGLRANGYDAYTVAQEHSCVKDFWKRRNPDLLIMIDATLPAIKQRRLVSWDESRLVIQHDRLRNAREHAALYIQTDSLNKTEVLTTVINFIGGQINGESNLRRSEE